MWAMNRGRSDVEVFMKDFGATEVFLVANETWKYQIKIDGLWWYAHSSPTGDSASCYTSKGEHDGKGRNCDSPLICWKMHLVQQKLSLQKSLQHQMEILNKECDVLLKEVSAYVCESQLQNQKGSR